MERLFAGQVELMENMPQKQIQTVRMAEIAQRLNVASSTISRALRDDPRISLELRNRVRSVAEELGYRPNPLVSALMANRRRRGSGGAVDVIALVTNYGGRKHWRSKDVCRWEYEGIERRARELGFRVEIFALSDYRGGMIQLQATLRARAIRGVLLGFSREEKPNTIFDCAEFVWPASVATSRKWWPTGQTFTGSSMYNWHSIRCIVMGIAALRWWHPH
jgi:hypothetical protein